MIIHFLTVVKPHLIRGDNDAKTVLYGFSKISVKSGIFAVKLTYSGLFG